MHVFLIFPHQLFKSLDAIPTTAKVVLVEERLFFGQYAFHKQKLWFHRLSMQRYKSYLEGQLDTQIDYIPSSEAASDIRVFVNDAYAQGITKISFYHVVDHNLAKYLQAFSGEIEVLPTPNFINLPEENKAFFDGKKRLFQTDFYIWQRKRFKILLDETAGPVGGSWTYDTDNRKAYPKGQKPPKVLFAEATNLELQVASTIEAQYGQNPGQINLSWNYPSTHQQAETWLETFLVERFADFGPYEDALVKAQHVLNHSLLSPLINTGLLDPKQVVNAIIAHSKQHDIPLPSLEGLLRQIIGWREFIQAVYTRVGVKQRTTNFWGFSRKIPPSFYDGTTGIEPVDEVIKKVLKTGYAHHIERLMVLGNFMLLCEFDPDEVYRWFMELFIDAYDWVMVPNVYGMVAFADGGLMTTKPYISGSNYLMKMSDFGKGPWQATWDGLFWHFMDKQRVFFKKNPRLSMLVSSFDKMDISKKEAHLKNAEAFLNKLDVELSQQV
jgi:deoxyribodipyrimidine photolyase-related protein